ncbi:MAG: sugar transferase [Clostridia bacterium]|nr:sugar transferase [Clostridia bacterium]
MSRYTLTAGQKAYGLLKNLLDFLIAFAAFLILLLPLLLLAAVIKMDDPGPVFFCQKRIGKNQRPFMMLKFRTMRTDTPKDTPTHLLKNPEQYITRTGRFLRKTSLDELPQLLNILVGHMSIVGPRPALWNQDDLNEAREALGVHQVRPGLTGWAQINGRDELEIPVKAALDGEYLRKFGLWMDIRCFFGTFRAVLSGKGVVEGGTGAMHDGTNNKK